MSWKPVKQEFLPLLLLLLTPFNQVSGECRDKAYFLSIK
jgi:hypothetical protein